MLLLSFPSIVVLSRSKYASAFLVGRYLDMLTGVALPHRMRARVAKILTEFRDAEYANSV